MEREKHLCVHEEGNPDYALVPLTTLHTACFHDRTARLFDKDNFFKPLVAGEDVLDKRHANTHLAQAGQPTPYILASSLLKPSRPVCMPMFEPTWSLVVPLV